MYNFASDYLEGAHPQVMEALNKTNFIQTVGYGEDQYCQKAKDKIKTIKLTMKFINISFFNNLLSYFHSPSINSNIIF